MERVLYSCPKRQLPFFSQKQMANISPSSLGVTRSCSRLKRTTEADEHVIRSFSRTCGGSVRCLIRAGCVLGWELNWERCVPGDAPISQLWWDHMPLGTTGTNHRSISKERLSGNSPGNSALSFHTRERTSERSRGHASRDTPLQRSQQGRKYSPEEAK